MSLMSGHFTFILFLFEHCVWNFVCYICIVFFFMAFMCVWKKKFSLDLWWQNILKLHCWNVIFNVTKMLMMEAYWSCPLEFRLELILLSYVKYAYGTHVESFLTCIHHNPTNHLCLPLWVANVLAFTTNLVKKINVVDEVKTMKEWNKKIYEPSRKCQDTWATFFPSIELLQWNDKEVHNVKCVICSKIMKKEKGPHYGPRIKHTWETCKLLQLPRIFAPKDWESCLIVNKKSQHFISNALVKLFHYTWICTSWDERGIKWQ